MIAVDRDLSLMVLDRLHATAVYDRLSPDLIGLCKTLLATVIDNDFPGALIPSLQGAGDVHVYAVAPTAAQWRRLAPLLSAFAGPTLSSFDGLPLDLPADDPVAAVVRLAEPTTTAILRLPGESKRTLGGLRALVRMRDTLARAPVLQRRAPEPTSWLLAQFQDYLNVGAPEAAVGLLKRLRAELRLDTLNLKFLEVHFLATVEDWPRILSLQGFANLCHARKPPAISALLLEALYRGYVVSAFEAGDDGATRAAYEEHVRPLAQPMLSSPAPATLTAGGWRLLALEAWIAPSRRDLVDAVSSRRDKIGWLVDKFAGALPSLQPEAPRSPIDAARSALTAFDAGASLDAVAAAIATLEKLDPIELGRLREAEPFRSLLQALQQEMPVGRMPRSWLDWLERAADPAFITAMDVARQGMDEWPVDEALNDPVAVQQFVAALNRAQEVELAAERTTHALPFVTGWLQRDPLFPRNEAVPIYSSLLTLFALSATRGRGTYESSKLLVHAMLASGLDANGYRGVISDIEELAGQGFGVEMIYWLLEVIEDLLRFGSPVADLREAFLHSALAKMAPIYGRMSSLQRSAVSRLSTELGWDLASFGVSTSGTTGDSYSERLAGKRIAIYGLNESATRQAKIAIEEIAPTALVDCNGDHVGSGRLRALSQNADIFVLVWQSAKHAATDFIREHRSDRPLLYAQGRGYSSILRAIEAHLRGAEL